MSPSLGVIPSTLTGGQTPPLRSFRGRTTLARSAPHPAVSRLDAYPRAGRRGNLANPLHTYYYHQSIRIMARHYVPAKTDPQCR